MLKTLLGADGFRAGMDLYFDRHDGDGGDGRGLRRLFRRARRGVDLTRLHALVHPVRHARGDGRRPPVGRGRTGGFQDRLRSDGAADPGPADQEADADPRSASGWSGRTAPTCRRRESPEPRSEGDVHGARGKRASRGGVRGARRPVRCRRCCAASRRRCRLTSTNLDVRPISHILAANDGDPFNRWQAIQSLAIARADRGDRRGARTSATPTVDRTHRRGDRARPPASSRRSTPSFRALAVASAVGGGRGAGAGRSTSTRTRSSPRAEHLRGPGRDATAATVFADLYARSGAAKASVLAPDAASAGRRDRCATPRSTIW